MGCSLYYDIEKISYDIACHNKNSKSMARKSLIARNEKRIKLANKYAKKRAELKANGDWEGLQKLPRNSSPVRIRNRCFITGRSRGYIRSFNMSRISLREQVSKGYVPGVKKSSW